MNDTTFEAFALAEPLNRALGERGYSVPTPIQTQALPPQLAGQDLLALAETGSGKTAAFVLPILNEFAASGANPKTREALTLILAPTRELALQIDGEVAALAKHLPIRRAVLLGGVGKFPQINALKRGVHILVATPGRLLDLVSERHCDLRAVRTLVLDEADRMFDMGFIRDVRKIVSMLSHKRRTALFSATMPDEIRKLADELLTEPARIDLSPKKVVVDRIAQSVMLVRAPDKQSRLHTILGDTSASRVIVFTRTKRGADRVADRLAMAAIGAAAIHGNKTQGARQRALADFASGHVRVLVATDIAARGIDVSNVTHVINFDMPTEPETYVHRIGRTARKGESGIAISLCDPSERGEIAAIEKLMKQKITVIDDVGGEPVAMPERRPHHTHEAPRREGRHRKGPAHNGARHDGYGEGRGRGDNGRAGGRRDGAEAAHAPRNSHPHGDRDRRAGEQRGGEWRNGQGGQRDGQRPARERDQRDTRGAAGEDGRRNEGKSHRNGERPHRNGGGRGHEHGGQRTHENGTARAHGHGAPRAHNTGAPRGHGDTGASRAQDDTGASRAQGKGQRRGEQASFGGFKPPKFMKQRGQARSYSKPGGKPAA